MIIGTVSAALEASISLFVEDDLGQTYPFDASIDTGFSRFLALSPAIVASLMLKWKFKKPFGLADGSIVHVDVFDGVVIWHGQPRTIEIDAVGKHLLVGMKMLAGHEVRMRVVDGGPVWIDVVP